MQSAHDAALALLDALTDTDAEVRRHATTVSASIGFDLFAIRGELRSTRDTSELVHATGLRNLIDTLVRTALRSPTLLVFDEFQQLGVVDNGTSLLRALRLLAHDESLYGTVASRIDLIKSAGQQARARLTADGHVLAATDGRHAVTDPLLADWLRREHPV